MNGNRALVRDPGLQPERTILSWQRTLVVLAAVGLLYLRNPFSGTASTVGQEIGPLERLVPALLIAVPVAVLTVHVRMRWRRTDHGHHDDSTGTAPAPLARPWALFLLSFAVILLSVAVAASAVVA